MGKYTEQNLVDFEPRHSAFVGIDSDGCVFDSMVTKQCRHFHPQIIRIWGLEEIEPQLREVAEFVNLYSVWRGSNRYPALLKVFELLEEREDVKESGVELPKLDGIRAYIESGVSLGIPSLEDAVAGSSDSELHRMLEWSRAVNEDIDSNMEAIPPFRNCVEALRKIHAAADAIVVSQTPEDALVKEWHQHEIDQYVNLIAGQELGSKAHHLELAAIGKYPKERILLIGDAPGDRKAAESVGVCFFPIMPGHEDASWELFNREAFERFLAGKYAGAYQDALIAGFENELPSTPPW